MRATAAAVDAVFLRWPPGGKQRFVRATTHVYNMDNLDVEV